MKNEKMIHNWMVSHLKGKLSREYDEIKVNIDGEENEFKGFYPDVILSNHGLVLAIMEIETGESITQEKAEKWKDLSGLGAKLILMIPQHTKARVLDLLWKQGIAGKASVGTYEMNIRMP